MKTNDFIAVKFPQEANKTYYAVVTATLPDSSFDCRFVHSGSNYRFKADSGWLTVVKTEGAFPVGTRTNKVTLFTESTRLPLAVNGPVRVTFDDGKAYLGIVKHLENPREISFLHSDNTYTFSADGIAHKPGGPYNGRSTLEIKAYEPGVNLFSGTHSSALSLSINDAFGKQLIGEFDIRIKRTDTDQIVYENNFLSAEESTASDSLDLALMEGQGLIIMVDFHPALNPFYTSHPISSPMIDRETTIPGSKTFAYRKLPELHFDVTIQNEVATLTSTSSQEAILTLYKEVSTNASHTFETKFEGEAGIKLFGVGGTVTGGGGTGDTLGSATTGGTNDARGNTTGLSSTWNVYYPMGLRISPTFN